MKPLISIIVPVYKVEAYLEDCVNSLLCQTLENIEIILIDDGSPDRCGEMCDVYAAKDMRIRVIHQENQGLSAARNAGIDAAQADYLMFVDSDDWVDPEFCSHPYELALQHNADFVVFQFERINKSFHQCTEKSGIKGEAHIQWLMLNSAGVMVWNKLYHRKLFENVRFPVGKLFEDSAITHIIAHYAQIIYYSERSLYHYRIREASIMTSLKKADMLEQYTVHMARSKDLALWGFYDLAVFEQQRARWLYLLLIGDQDETGADCLTYYRQLSGYPPFFSWKARRMLDLLHISPSLFHFICHISGRRIK